MMQNPFIFESEGFDDESRFDEMYEFGEGEYDETEYDEAEYDEAEYDEAEYDEAEYDARQYEDQEVRRPVVRDHRANVSRPVVRDHRAGVSRPPVRSVPRIASYNFGRPVVRAHRRGYARPPARVYPRNFARQVARSLARNLTPKYPWRRPYPPHWRYPRGRRYPPGWRYPVRPGYPPPTGAYPPPAYGGASDAGAPTSPPMSAPMSAPAGDPNGELIRMIQRMLNRMLNLNIPEDGVLNVETKNALLSLQNQQGAPPETPPAAPGEPPPGGDQPQSEYYEFEDEYGDYESEDDEYGDFEAEDYETGDYEYGDYESNDYEYGETPFAFEASPAASAPVNLASTPCPLHTAGQTTARCRTPQRCPAIPNLLCVTAVNNIPFEYVADDGMIRKNRRSGLYEVVRRFANRKQKFIPPVGQSLARFLALMNRAGMPVEAILTAGTLYCRCITGTNTLSNHSYGDAIDIVGIRWRAPNGARETLVHNYQNPAERAILRRIDACLRLAFPNVIDYYHHRHRDHFHCDMNRGRGRVLRSATAISFVQEALGKVTGQSLKITGKLDTPTKKALSAFSGRGVQELARPEVLGEVFDNLFERTASA